MWVTGSNEKKPDNPVYIFKNGNRGFRARLECLSMSDCHSREHNSVLFAIETFLKENC